ncbi:MAG TPA: hypothetical protein VGF91_09115 [Solirubrobacteraceae bacterium]|jgi:hypothetical protein
MHTPTTRILSALAYDRGEEYGPGQPVAPVVELAAGARGDGRFQITTRRRADHFLQGGQNGGEGGPRRPSRPF